MLFIPNKVAQFLVLRKTKQILNNSFCSQSYGTILNEGNINEVDASVPRQVHGN